MKVLSIDPSLLATGWAVLTVSNKKRISLISCGWIPTKRNAELQVTIDDMKRVEQIAAELSRTIELHSIESIYSEVPLGAKSAKAAKSLSMAKSIVATLVGVFALKSEYANPFRIKIDLCNNKSASKSDIVKVVEKAFPQMKKFSNRLNKKNDFTLEHQARCDAIAVTLALVKRHERINSD